MSDMRLTQETSTDQQTKITSGVQVHYGDTHAIKDVSVEILDKTVTRLLAPLGAVNPHFCAHLIA